MTDQTAPDTTNHDRRLAHSWAETVKVNPECWGQRQLAAARVILEAVPAPTPPTLADMTDEERAACVRMQCDTGPNRSVRGFIADVYPGGCRVIERDTWAWRSCSDDLVTPRPDLPRMEWPGDQKPDPALPDGWLFADHKTLGRVVVTRPEPNNDGDVLIVCPVPDGVMRTDLFWCHIDTLTFLDAEPEADQ